MITTLLPKRPNSSRTAVKDLRVGQFFYISDPLFRELRIKLAGIVYVVDKTGLSMGTSNPDHTYTGVTYPDLEILVTDKN